MQDCILELNKVSPVLLSIVGLFFSVIGGFLVSIEALGIKEALAYRNDGASHHQRRTDTHLNAMVNRASVFLFVNLIWFIILVYFIRIPIVVSLMIFFLGYYIWKLLIWIINLLKDIIYKFDKVLRIKDRGCLLQLILFPFGLIWLLAYVASYLLSIIIEFGIDLPFRCIGEKIIARIVLRIFDKVYLLLKKMEREVFKTPILLGAIFLIIGFIYQLLGTILSLVQN